MTAKKPAKPADPAADLSEAEVREVTERKAGSSRVVHEVIRQQGDEGAARPPLALALAGLVGGVSISASVIAEAALRVRLPDEPWAELVSGLGYTVGFIIAIMGRLQLFTENTVTAVLPVATQPNWANFAITYTITIGGFSHVIAGSTEMWTLWLAGRIGFGAAMAGILLPTLLGNIIGGTGLFAVLAHGQAKGEL